MHTAPKGQGGPGSHLWMKFAGLVALPVIQSSRRGSVSFLLEVNSAELLALGMQPALSLSPILTTSIIFYVHNSVVLASLTSQSPEIFHLATLSPINISVPSSPTLAPPFHFLSS